jgi:hypothetical protein
MATSDTPSTTQTSSGTVQTNSGTAQTNPGQVQTNPASTTTGRGTVPANSANRSATNPAPARRQTQPSVWSGMGWVDPDTGLPGTDPDPIASENATVDAVKWDARNEKGSVTVSVKDLINAIDETSIYKTGNAPVEGFHEILLKKIGYEPKV